MKKTLSLVLALVLALSLTACGGSKADSGDDAAASNLPADALTLLTTVWDSIPEDAKFPAAGGDAENAVDGAPGTFDISDADNLNYMLTFPTEDVDKIDAAASLVHMMNLNSFTCGAFHAVSADDVSALAQDLRDAIASKRWMCGFPDKLVVITLGEYVVSMYGLNENIDTFRDKLVEAYPDAVIAFEEAVA